MQRPVFAHLCWVLLISSPAVAQPSVVLTVDQAVARALEQGLEMQESDAEIEAAEAAWRATKALYGPRVMVEGKAFYFNERPTFELDLGTGELPLAMEQMVGSLLPSGPMDAGEQYNINFSVTVAQPLTKLETIREISEIKRLDVDIAKVHRDKSSAGLAYQVREASYQLLQIRATIDSLVETETEVVAREKQVKAFRAAELIGPEQVLEVGVKLAEIRQGIIKARAFESVAESRLRVLARLEPGTAITVAEPGPPSPPPALADAISRAKKARTELAELRLKGQQAKVAVKVKVQDFVPDISLVASYQYQAGTTFGQPEFAVGAVMSWTPFAWGETLYAVRSAKATARRAEIALERVDELIALDVERAHAGVRAAQETITVAQVAMAQAAELVRIEGARFDVRDTTATDLLSAQTSLLRAKTTLRAARYDYLIALADLRQAMGEM